MWFCINSLNIIVFKLAQRISYSEHKCMSYQIYIITSIPRWEVGHNSCYILLRGGPSWPIYLYCKLFFTQMVLYCVLKIRYIAICVVEYPILYTHCIINSVMLINYVVWYIMSLATSSYIITVYIYIAS